MEQRGLFDGAGDSLPPTPAETESAGKTGIYAIRRLASNKRYIGSASVSLPGRWVDHRKDLRGNRHYNDYLQKAWNKYGEEAFVFEVIEYCPPEACLDREQFWIDHYQSYDERFGYNLCPKAANSAGYKHTEETRARMREAWASGNRQPPSPEHLARLHEMQKGRKRKPETIAKMREAMKGRVRTPEHSANISKAKKGKKLSEEEKAKRRGWKHTDEAKAKLSAINTGRKHSEETKQKLKERQLSEAQLKALKEGRSKPLSQESREKIAAKLRGQVISPETRAKISAAHKARKEAGMPVGRRAGGEDNGQSKLTEDQVREIRRRCVLGSRTSGAGALAREFGVSQPVISAIVARKIWKHVE